MAFIFKDFFRSYVKRGDQQGLFNVARTDMDISAKRYHAYINENGAYIIQLVTTDGTLTNKVYKYYAKQDKAKFDVDWGNRANLTYVEFWQLFPQG